MQNSAKRSELLPNSKKNAGGEPMGTEGVRSGELAK